MRKHGMMGKQNEHIWGLSVFMMFNSILREQKHVSKMCFSTGATTGTKQTQNLQYFVNH